jgi:hypothetical protein
MNFLPIPSAMMPAPLFLRESMIWVFSEFRGLSGDFGSDVNPESRTVSRLGGGWCGRGTKGLPQRRAVGGMALDTIWPYRIE